MKRIVIVLAVLLGVAGANGQTKWPEGQGAKKQYVAESARSWQAYKSKSPKKAEFPEKYVYYDEKRGGYVYWENGTWFLRPSVAPYMEKVDMSKERLRVSKGLTINLKPELGYPRYVKMYPAIHQNNLVAVPLSSPLPGNP
jgi:hypothetical protein